jgi:hypothetical protein
MDTEMDTELIREALTLQAERAPDTREVYRTLRLCVAEQDRRRRRARIALIAVGTATAVAAAPLLATVQWHRASPAVGPASGGSGQLSTSELPRDVPLQFRPTWLPPGLHEAATQATFDNTSAVRTYVRGDVDPEAGGADTLTITVTVDAEVGPPGYGVLAQPVLPEDTSVGSFQDPPSHWLSWTPVSGVRVDVLATNLQVTDAQLERIVANLVPDDTRRTIPLRIGWLPEEATPTGALVPAAGSRSRTTVTADGLEVTVAAATPARTGEPVTLDGGRQGRLRRAGGGVLVLEAPLTGNRVLRLTANRKPSASRPPITEVDLLRIAQSVQLDIP